MADLSGQIGELRMTIEIVRKETGQPKHRQAAHGHP